MNETIKLKITELRNQGLGYKKISMQLGINVNSVKSYCQRNVILKRDSTENRCGICHQVLNHVKGKKKKRFCSDRCRMRYWNQNQNKLNSEKMQTMHCRYCRRLFKAYTNRKYCCHVCYIQHRFIGGIYE